MTAITECYARLTNPYGTTAPWYTRPQGHSGADYAAAAGGPVVAYEEITITTVEWSSFIGWCVEGRAKDGAYIGWAHLRNVRVKVGDKVKAGVKFAEVAGAADRPGETWDGAHIHTTLGNHSGAIFWGMTYNPMKRINAAKAASIAGSGGSIIPKEDEVITYPNQDRRTKTVKPGSYDFQRNSANTADQNVIGAVGAYSVACEVSATGTPGDILEILLMRQDQKLPSTNLKRNSDYYTHRMVIPGTGELHQSAVFNIPRKMTEGGKIAFFSKVRAPKTNKSTIAVTVQDSIAHCFI